MFMCIMVYRSIALQNAVMEHANLADEPYNFNLQSDDMDPNQQLGKILLITFGIQLSG